MKYFMFWMERNSIRQTTTTTKWNEIKSMPLSFCTKFLNYDDDDGQTENEKWEEEKEKTFYFAYYLGLGVCVGEYLPSSSLSFEWYLYIESIFFFDNNFFQNKILLMYEQKKLKYFLKNHSFLFIYFIVIRLSQNFFYYYSSSVAAAAAVIIIFFITTISMEKRLPGTHTHTNQPTDNYTRKTLNKQILFCFSGIVVWTKYCLYRFTRTSTIPIYYSIMRACLFHEINEGRKEEFFGKWIIIEKKGINFDKFFKSTEKWMNEWKTAKYSFQRRLRCW